jgi:hypothetical protein
MVASNLYLAITRAISTAACLASSFAPGRRIWHRSDYCTSSHNVRSTYMRCSESGCVPFRVATMFVIMVIRHTRGFRLFKCLL